MRMKRKRIVSLLLALLMLISVIPFSVFAESEVMEDAAAPFEEVVEISEENPEAEIIVEEAEQGDPPEETEEEPTEEEQPTKESEDAPFKEEKAEETDTEETDTEEYNAEDADTGEDKSVPDDPDPIETEDEGTDEEEEFSDPEQSADADEEDDPQEDENVEEPVEDDPGQEPDEASAVYTDPWEEAISLFGHAYGRTKNETCVYADESLNGDPIFIISREDSVLLATEYKERDGKQALLIWCLSEDAVISGYVACNALKDDVMTDAAELADFPGADKRR